jgi:Na+-driven multidrug efflux pump
VVSWNFVAAGFVFTCSAVFQGLGNTVPAVMSSATRFVSFAMPALWLASRPNFQLVQLWYVSIVSTTLQAVVSLWLVRGQFRRRLRSPAAAALTAR